MITLIPLQEMWPNSGAEAEVVRRSPPTSVLFNIFFLSWIDVCMFNNIHVFAASWIMRKAQKFMRNNHLVAAASSALHTTVIAAAVAAATKPMITR